MNTFAEVLTYYISVANCSFAELAEKSGLSPASISRYCSGSRVPKQSSPSVAKLAHGLSLLCMARSVSLSEEEICQALSAPLSQSNYVDFSDHFDALIIALKISTAELAKSINYDPSYLSRIRTGQRTPLNLDEFVESTCRFVVRRYPDTASMTAVCSLIGCEMKQLSSPGSYLNALLDWFGCPVKVSVNKMDRFLRQLDEFDLNEYIRSIHFDELKVPNMPLHLPTSKHYYGLEQMKQGELDFFRATVLARSMEDIFMCSDMQMDDMAQDVSFGKKWMFAIAMSLKKGLHINIIHNIDRPFNEMMLGLESWIPIYMTGQVSPYHFVNSAAPVFHHLTYVSGAAALNGESIDGHHTKGRYYLTNNKRELAYFKQKAKLMLSKATPLMEIFRETERAQFEQFVRQTRSHGGTRRNILSALPLYTLSEALLNRILRRNNVSGAMAEDIRAHVHQQKEWAEQVLAISVLRDEIPELSSEEFAQKPTVLPLSDIFLEKEVFYTYEDYTEHLRLTLAYRDCRENYQLTLCTSQAFRNIQIHILEDEWVLISKNKSPNIHFLIRHPKMVNALQNFIVPVFD